MEMFSSHWLPNYRKIYLTGGALGRRQVPHRHFPLSEKDWRASTHMQEQRGKDE